MSGAIDNDWSESERSTCEVFEEAVEDLHNELAPDTIALDLVTRQPVYVRRKKADDLVEFYEDEGFDLFSYKTHPYLPVKMTDRVFECVYIGTNPQQAHKAGKTYDVPEGRLMRVPIAEAWD